MFSFSSEAVSEATPSGSFVDKPGKVCWSVAAGDVIKHLDVGPVWNGSSQYKHNCLNRVSVSDTTTPPPADAPQRLPDFEIFRNSFTEVWSRTPVLYGVTQRRWVRDSGRFGCTCCLHIQGFKVFNTFTMTATRSLHREPPTRRHCLASYDRFTFLTIHLWLGGPGSSVGIATELRAGQSGIEYQWGRDFPPVQTDSRAHPASCTMGTGSFPGVEAAGAWGWLSTPI